ncbi:MAG: hypothetical protein ACFB15_29460 [Cyclobacteriaceae bacterium]
MKYTLILLISCFSTLSTGFRVYEDKLVPVKVSDEIGVSLPESFQPMTEEQMQRKILSARPPLAAYTSPDQRADFSVSASNTRWQANDLPILKDFYRSSLMELYDDVDFLDEGIRTVDKVQAAFFEFTSVVKEDENAVVPKPPVHTYTFVQYTIHQGKTLVFTFSCPLRQQEQWQPTAQKVMNSVKLK